MNLMPRQALLVELLHEWIGVELLDVVNAWGVPQTLAEHHSTNHGRYTSGVAYPLHASLLVGCAMAAVVVYIVGVLLAILANTTNATADGGFTFIVLTQVLWVGQYGLQDLKGDNLYFGGTCSVCQWCLLLHLVDAAHTNVLNHFEVLQILLSEGHPEAGTLDVGVIDDQ